MKSPRDRVRGHLGRMRALAAGLLVAAPAFGGGDTGRYMHGYDPVVPPPVEPKDLSPPPCPADAPLHPDTLVTADAIWVRVADGWQAKVDLQVPAYADATVPRAPRVYGASLVPPVPDPQLWLQLMVAVPAGARSFQVNLPVTCGATTSTVRIRFDATKPVDGGSLAATVLPPRPPKPSTPSTPAPAPEKP